MHRTCLRLCLLLWGVASLAAAQSVDPAQFSDMRWRLVGPFRGGWATCAEGVPDDPTTYYFGAAAGGVWKTEDAGRTWKPIFEEAPAASIGDLALAPSNPGILYVGTGQIHARYDIASGDGVFRSDDAGKTWKNLGLAQTRAIGRILVDPANADVALVAALGHIYGPNRERGVFRTEDGGKSWSQVLFVDPNTGAADLAADPENPSVVYASTWQARNYPWQSYFTPVAGPGSGLYKSTDGGRTWKRLSGGGWPAGSLGRIGLAASRGGRVWALVDAPGPAPSAAGLYRSDDAGASWKRVNATAGLASSYMNRLTPDPRERDTVFISGQSLRVTRDGGATLDFFKGAPGGDDYHYFWINPKHPQHMITAADQGTQVSQNGGKSWSDWYNQPTGQFYHVETDDEFPYGIYSGQQDSGTARVASRSDYGALGYRDWHPVGGEERGWDVPDPEDAAIVYGTGLGGTITRFDTRTGEVRNVSPVSESTYGRRPVGLTYRWPWIFSLAMSKKPPFAMYTGSQYVLRSLDRGRTWEKASPDLSGARPDAKNCGGDLGLEAARACGYGVVFTIALSPRDADEIWAGTDDGLVHVTRDGGKSWKNVTPSGLPAWSKIATLDVSALESGVVYAAVDRHRLDDFTPHVLRTRDFGASWQEISNGLPAPGFVTSVRCDPVRKGLLYAGTDDGVFVSFDDGARWQPLRLNLPTCWVGDLTVHGQDLVAATQGRAMWVLDDVSPLRQAAGAAPGTGARLLAPSPAVRVRANENRDTPLPPETPLAKNPPPGAVIDYVLAGAAKGPVRIEIRDARGELVRAFASDDPPDRPDARRYFPETWVRPPGPPPTTPGHHRLVWDLRYSRPNADRYDYTIAAIWGENTPVEPRGPLAIPGTYTVRLTVDGAAQDQPLTLLPDPRVEVPAETYSRKLAFEREIVEALEGSSEALDAVRALRKKTPARPGAADDRAAKLQKGLEEVNGLLAGILPAVDGADTMPTAVQTEALASGRTRLDSLLAEWKTLSAAPGR